MTKAIPKRKTKGNLRSSVSGKYTREEGADPATTVREKRERRGAEFPVTVIGLYPDDDPPLVELEYADGETFTLRAGLLEPGLAEGDVIDTEWRKRR